MSKRPQVNNHLRLLKSNTSNKSAVQAFFLVSGALLIKYIQSLQVFPIISIPCDNVFHSNAPDTRTYFLESGTHV